ncbi:unnamed protein product [Blepharisma stoltei]|uniref:Uncharacterized protein n=1 Tax=Blepharisma stoltei TaxID=1481888 RepID=A0AAU9IUB5_9CILI|nr:unnamed protein product [Blepharisma stoltei]
MESLKLLLIFIISAYAVEEIEKNYCWSYQCKTNTTTFNSSTCIYPNTLYSTYVLNACTSSSTPYCPPIYGTYQNSSCTTIPDTTAVTNLYPGETCSANSMCASNNCTKAHCVGVSLNGTCTKHDYCGPGLRCASGTCKALLNINEVGCTTDYDCVPKAGCNITSTGGVCVEYFSLPLSSVISNCTKTKQGGYSNLCKSGVCLYTSLFSTKGTCSNAPTSVATTPQQCTSDSQCMGKTETNTYFTSCQCGMNPSGLSYCQPFYGDSPYLNYISSYRTFMWSEALDKCNTVRRFDDNCWKMTVGQNYTNLYVSKYQIENYPQLQNNDACTKTIYFSNYYSKTYSGAASLIISLYLLMLS